MRSGLAVLAGYVAALVFVFAYHATHDAIFGTGAPGTVATLVGLGFGLLSAVIGGRVTARLAPSAPLTHAWGLVAFSLTIGIVFLIGVPVGAHWQVAGRETG